MKLNEKTFGGAVKSGAGAGAMVATMLSADGNPLIAVPIGTAVGALAGGITHAVRSVAEVNQNIKQEKAIAERRAAREAQKAANIEAREASLSRQLKGK